MSISAAAARANRLALEPLERIGQFGGTFKGAIPSYKAIWDHRELLVLLVKRELRARYKNSALGVLWSLVRPLAQLLIYYFAIGEIMGLARNIPSFAIFVFVGLTAWTLFSEIVSGGTTSIIANGGLVKKVYLPREIFPLSTVGGALFNFAIQFGILLLATIVVGQFPLTTNALSVIPAFLVILVFGTAFAFLLGALNVYFRDLEHLVEVAMVVFFWASPIVYSFSFVNAQLQGSLLEQVYLSNPMTLAILGFQKAIWVAGSSNTSAVNWPADLDLRIWIALAVGLVLLWISQRVFARLQGDFAQEL
ncbi:ABC transporter permease [Mycetocola zhadangensis]|uniref:ABC transporter permease n=1 Tax=Mycetocola zhadangensis TaxID=1164595 RepID=UPI003A4E2EFE